jgi:hypothetical protein
MIPLPDTMHDGKIRLLGLRAVVIVRHAVCGVPAWLRSAGGGRVCQVCGGMGQPGLHSFVGADSPCDAGIDNQVRACVRARNGWWSNDNRWC